jgi:hypothetical protein
MYASCMDGCVCVFIVCGRFIEGHMVPATFDADKFPGWVSQEHLGGNDVDSGDDLEGDEDLADDLDKDKDDLAEDLVDDLTRVDSQVDTDELEEHVQLFAGGSGDSYSPSSASSSSANPSASPSS